MACQEIFCRVFAALISVPAIGADGTIYVGSWGGNLYAIYGSPGGLARTAWPMFHRDLKHTGRVTKALPLIGIGIFSLWGGLCFTIYAVTVAAISAIYSVYIASGWIRKKTLKYTFIILVGNCFIDLKNHFE